MRSILDLPHLPDDPAAPFPPTSRALHSPNGLLAWGGDLHPTRLLTAYTSGIFPWYSEDQPVLWWTPAPRCVLVPEEVYLSKRTRRRYNSGRYRLTLDRAFTAVMEACAEPRPGESGTWITRDMVVAYDLLHEQGVAHSLEVWEGDGLVGGIYGLSIGSIFFGESMFSRRTDASKIALVALCRLLVQWGYALLDCQVGNPHLFRMGAREMSRAGFELMLAQNVSQNPGPRAWRDPCPFPARW